MRFTMTRAVVGLRRSTSQRARPSRLRGASFGNGFNTAGTSGTTFSPGCCQSPRLKTCASRGTARCCRVRPVGQHIVDFLVRFGEAGVLAAEHIEQFELVLESVGPEEWQESLV